MDLETETKIQGNARTSYYKFENSHKINRSGKPTDPQLLQCKTRMNMYENKTVT